MKVKVDGLSALERSLAKLADVDAPMATALESEAQAVFRESQKQVPVDTGLLKASGYVTTPRQTGDTIEVEVGYTTPYVVFVHERLDLRHAGETKAKFLEDPMRAAEAGVAERLAAKVEFKL